MSRFAVVLGGGPGHRRDVWPRILPGMGRLLLRIAAGVAAVIAVFWVLSMIVGLLVWLVMIALLVGVVFLGIRMLRVDSRR